MLLTVGFAVYEVSFAGPATHIKSGETQSVIDLRFLGEYCIGISHIRLRDCQSGTIIWEVQAISNNDTGICNFALQVGDNPALVGQPVEHQFAVIHPSGTTFHINVGSTYELSVWGNNGFAHTTVTHRRIRF